MPQYEWQGAGSFRDGRSGEEYDPGAIITLPAEVGDPNDELVEVLATPEDADSADAEADVSGVEAEQDAEESDSATEESDDDTYYCGALTGDGTPCEREVESPDETCWGH